MELLGSLALEILVVVLLVVLNGLFAMSEMALVAARRSRLQAEADAGDAAARRALVLATDPSRFLSTVQVGITLVGVLAGAVSGATIADALGDRIDEIPVLRGYGDTIAIGLVVACITYLSLVVGELVPKHLALGRAEAIAKAVAGPMGTLSRMAGPLVSLLDVSTASVLRLLRVRPAAEQIVSEDEIRTLIAQGTRAGVFEESERDMLDGVLRLADRPVRTIMTPRPEMVWIDLADSPAEVRRKVVEHPFSRFPVTNGRLDEVVGVVETRDLLLAGVERGTSALKANLRSPVVVHEGASALRVLERFRTAPTTMAIVVNEFGGVEGIVTATHILEAIVGDIPAHGHEPGPQAVRREDGSWLVDGLMPVDEVRERIPGLTLPAGRDYSTLAGFVLARLGHIPKTGEHLETEGARYEVVDMDGRRIDALLVTPPAQPADGPPSGESR